MRSRDERRAAREREIARVARWMRRYGVSEDWVAKHVPKTVDNPQRCSCAGCGNWRQTEGPTIQERRADRP